MQKIECACLNCKFNTDLECNNDLVQLDSSWNPFNSHILHLTFILSIFSKDSII